MNHWIAVESVKIYWSDDARSITAEVMTVNGHGLKFDVSKSVNACDSDDEIKSKVRDVIQGFKTSTDTLWTIEQSQF